MTRLPLLAMGERPPERPAAPSASGRALWWPTSLAVVLLGFALFSRQRMPVLLTFVVSALLLLAWTVVLYASARRANRRLTFDVALRRQHWLQALAQGTLLLYWGWHTPIVYAFLPFVLAQLVFAYAFDSLLQWTRHGRWTLGFGPVPIIFSVNLFLWFRLDWFYWQFVLIAVGFAAKELIRWTRDGRPAHIFNPSSFPLALASVALLATGASDRTFGAVIANTQFDAPFMYPMIFLVALPAQLLFGVARMTLAAVVTMYAISLLYFGASGTYLFYDVHIPVPVFLGMHLLFTDPSTSPRSELGRIGYGVLYAVGTVALFLLLRSIGAPSFYDKLLPVPLMNLLVRAIDRAAASRWLAFLDPQRLGRSLTLERRNALFASIWAAAFLGLTAVGGVGDSHPGQYLPFWQQACRGGSERACAYAADLTAVYCSNGSGWACNEVGVLRLERSQPAESDFQRGCELGFAPACQNLRRAGGEAVRADPALADLPIVVRGTKPPLLERDPARLRKLACQRGWGHYCATASLTPPA